MLKQRDAKFTQHDLATDSTLRQKRDSTLC